METHRVALPNLKTLTQHCLGSHIRDIVFAWKNKPDMPQHGRLLFRVTMIILGTLGCTHGGRDFRAHHYYATLNWRRVGRNKPTYKTVHLGSAYVRVRPRPFLDLDRVFACMVFLLLRLRLCVPWCCFECQCYANAVMASCSFAHLLAILGTHTHVRYVHVHVCGYRPTAI